MEGGSYQNVYMYQLTFLSKVFSPLAKLSYFSKSGQFSILFSTFFWCHVCWLQKLTAILWFLIKLSSWDSFNLIRMFILLLLSRIPLLKSFSVSFRVLVSYIIFEIIFLNQYKYFYLYNLIFISKLQCLYSKLNIYFYNSIFDEFRLFVKFYSLGNF